MTEPTLPAPLTPADCNLRGFPWMALDTVRLLDSDLFLLATGDEFKAALALWCKSWSQVPAASLPNDERLLEALSGSKNWKKVRGIAMRGWILCSDDRWYHPVVAEKALEALPARKAHAEHKAASAERKERERADRKALFELLRINGVTAEYDTKTTKLREMAAPFLSTGQPLVTPPVTRDMSHHVTAKRGQDSTEQDSTFNSVPIGTGAVGAGKRPRTAAENRKSELWRAIKALLVESGESKDLKAAGAVVTQAITRYDEPTALAAIEATLHARPAGAIAFLEAACQQASGQRQNKQEALEAGNLAAAERFAATAD